MPAGPLALVLVSAFLHALWNALLKKQPHPDAAAVAVAAVAALCGAGLVPFFPGPSFPQPAGLGWGLGAGLFEGAYFATLALAFQHGSLALAYATSRGGAIALVWPVSVLWLGEAVTPTALSGATLVGAGMALLGYDSRGAKSARGFGWALLCACCIASYHLCYKRALLVAAQPAALSAVSLLVALPISVLLLGKGGLVRVGAAFRHQPAVLAAAGAVCASSFLVFLVALTSGGAGAVLTLRNTSVLFALGLSYGIGERPRQPQLLGAAAVALGAVLVGWPR